MLTNHSACMKHQRNIYAPSALYGLYSTAKDFEVWLHHDIYIIISDSVIILISIILYYYNYQ